MHTCFASAFTGRQATEFSELVLSFITAVAARCEFTAGNV